MAANCSVMITGPCPVLLVHGWNSHPGIWNRLIPRLSDASLTVWRFDHSTMDNTDIAKRAAALRNYIRDMRNENNYRGPVNIVCHSVGTCITRYLLEVMDGAERKEKVRQLIGLGPPNNGSVLAELFHDPLKGRDIINRLTGVFVPQGFDPSTDLIVQDVRPASPAMQKLRLAGTRDDITYRIIVTANPKGMPDFFPLFDGKTWDLKSEGGWQETLEGDGIVPHSESLLSGISLDILPAGQKGAGPLPPPDQYCHINLPKNPVVIDRIMHYLTTPMP